MNKEIEKSPSQQERQDLGRKLSSYFSEYRIVFVGNVPHALPPASRTALTNHTVPPGAYEGRMPWIAAAYRLPEAPIVVMQENPVPAEISLLKEICTQHEIPPPEVVIVPKFSYSEVPVTALEQYMGKPAFVHPFIGSRELQLQNTTPDAARYNNKAQMKLMMRDAGMGNNIVDGVEVIANEGDTANSMANKISEAISQVDFPIAWVKLGESASGMGTNRVDVQRFKSDTTYQAEMQINFHKMFTSEGKEYPADVVIEKEVAFGQAQGYSDYGARGYLLPNGEFKFFSVGRVVSTSEGVYQGMIMASPEKADLIGLSPSGISEVKRLMSRFAQAVHLLGYWGPVNLDMFIAKNPYESPGKVHDWNMRDGGSSASGNIASLISDGAAIDIDLKLNTPTALSENQGNHLVETLWREEHAVTYATTFLRHPKKTGSDWSHTVKLIVPISGSVDSDQSALDQIHWVCDVLNTKNLGSFEFEEPK